MSTTPSSYVSLSFAALIASSNSATKWEKIRFWIPTEMPSSRLRNLRTWWGAHRVSSARQRGRRVRAVSVVWSVWCGQCGAVSVVRSVWCAWSVWTRYEYDTDPVEAFADRERFGLCGDSNGEEGFVRL